VHGIPRRQNTSGARRLAVRAGGLALIAIAVAAVALVVVNLRSTPGIEVPSPSPAAVPSASGPMTCMPQPSACGFPDRTNTGVVGGTTLSPESGAVTLSTPGQVYENKQLTGTITVTAPNVTIRNVKLIVADPSYGNKAFGWQNNVSGLKLEHVEIDLNGHYDVKGIAFDGYTASNVFIHNGSDCAHMGSNVTIQNSYCVLGPDANGDGAIDDGSFCNGPQHFDGLQSDGGRNITIRHNTIRNPCAQTSAILMSTNTERIENVTIDQNLVSGGGYTIYCGTDEGGVAANLTYTRNVISKEFFRNGGRYGSSTSCDKAANAGGNISDGEFVPDASQPGAPSPTAPPTRAPAARLGVSTAQHSARAALKRRLKTQYTKRAKRASTRCSRRTDVVVGCSVRWTRRQRGRTNDRYSGTVTVTRVSAAVNSCAIKLRRWQRGCGCTTRIPSARSRRTALTSSC
jgi:hypothetical protein